MPVDSIGIKMDDGSEILVDVVVSSPSGEGEVSEAVKQHVVRESEIALLAVKNGVLPSQTEPQSESPDWPSIVGVDDE